MSGLDRYMHARKLTHLVFESRPYDIVSSKTIVASRGHGMAFLAISPHLGSMPVKCAQESHLTLHSRISTGGSLPREMENSVVAMLGYIATFNWM